VNTLANRTFLPLAGAVLLLGLFIYYDLVVYRDYLLRGDEPAFVSATLESPASWFTRGYLNYFLIYPEWESHHTSPLLKPLTNAVGYLGDSLFGSTYALHFAVYFLFQFLGLLIFVRILRELAVPTLPAAGMSLLFLFNPAFMSDGPVCLSCHFDVLAGVFALAAFLAAWTHRYGAALAALTLAVFTKESAIYAPLAAGITLLVWRRLPLKSALLLLPLPLWALARFLVYGDVLDTGGTARLGQIAVGVSVWPTGLGGLQLLNQMGSLLSNRTQLVSAIFFVANIGLWVFLCYAVLTAARRYIDAPQRAELTTGLLIWSLGALAFGVVAGYLPRYGGSIYPFLYLFLAALFFSPDYRVPRWLAASVLLVFFAATFVQGARGVRLAFAWQPIIAPERALHDALSALPQDGRTVYVINAPPGLASAPRHISRAWSLNMNLVILNQFNGCTASPDGGSTELLDIGARIIGVRIPQCAAFNFRNAGLDALNRESDLVIERSGIGTYTFPGGKLVPAAETLSSGQTLMLQLDPQAADGTIIGYNWQTGRYGAITPL
jgi:hypothetical protein